MFTRCIYYLFFQSGTYAIGISAPILYFIAPNFTTGRHSTNVLITAIYRVSLSMTFITCFVFKSLICYFSIKVSATPLSFHLGGKSNKTFTQLHITKILSLNLDLISKFNSSCYPVTCSYLIVQVDFFFFLYSNRSFQQHSLLTLDRTPEKKNKLSNHVTFNLSTAFIFTNPKNTFNTCCSNRHKILSSLSKLNQSNLFKTCQCSTA